MQCQEELARLEVVSAKAMRAIIARNAAAARALCVSTGLPAPDLSAVLAGAQAEGSGQVSAALHKLSVVTAALREVVAAREPVMRGAQEVEDAFREVHWLVTHQQDAQFNNRVRCCGVCVPLRACVRFSTGFARYAHVGTKLPSRGHTTTR